MLRPITPTGPYVELPAMPKLPELPPMFIVVCRRASKNQNPFLPPAEQRELGRGQNPGKDHKNPSQTHGFVEARNAITIFHAEQR